jgi:hypothetical protein
VTPSLRTGLQSSSLLLVANEISDIALSLYSDAFVLARTPGDPGELRGGLGGFAHGYWWHHSLPRHITNLLHITAWKFMATALNLLVLSPIVAGHSFFSHADAVSTVQTMIRSGAGRVVSDAVKHELLIHSP